MQYIAEHNSANLNQYHKREQNDRCIDAYFKDQNWD